MVATLPRAGCGQSVSGEEIIDANLFAGRAVWQVDHRDRDTVEGEVLRQTLGGIPDLGVAANVGIKDDVNKPALWCNVASFGVEVRTLLITAPSSAGRQHGVA